ncbi:MAG: hypothetical protein LBR78_00175 [Holosporales bacterium]|jgi:hypothetical protein|nr:hypothetical protein [Holosporales bacterium]
MGDTTELPSIDSYIAGPIRTEHPGKGDVDEMVMRIYGKWNVTGWTKLGGDTQYGPILTEEATGQSFWACHAIAGYSMRAPDYSGGIQFAGLPYGFEWHMIIRRYAEYAPIPPA